MDPSSRTGEINKKYHFIAIGGSIMHNLAIDLASKGHSVTGSDDKIYDPARSNLAKAGLLPEKEGWYRERIASDLDGIILGMHARADNPELDEARKLGIPVYSFPQFIFEQSQEKKRIVIAGSHGKTTISSMVMHILKNAGVHFDYLVGASLEGYDRMVRLSNAPLIVIEGDEYLSSKMDLRPKFLHYKPDICVISGISWDHKNVFPTYRSYLKAFKSLIDSLPSSTLLIYNEKDSALTALLENTKADLRPYSILNGFIREGTQFISLDDVHIPIQIFGTHNLENLAAAIEVAKALGLEREAIFSSLSSFKGASMRLEKWFEDPLMDRIVFRDFAHAPSKVLATVNAVREYRSNHKLIAIFELHTFSSVDPEFITHYQGVLEKADKAAIYYDPNTSIKKKMDPLSGEKIRAAFASESLSILSDQNELKAFLATNNGKRTCFLLMSSGRFGDFPIVEFFEGELSFGA